MSYHLNLKPMSVSVRKGVKSKFRGRLIANSKLSNYVNCPKLRLKVNAKGHTNARKLILECKRCKFCVEIERNGVWCSFGF